MKRFILSSLSVLVLATAVAPGVQAQVTPETPPDNASTIGMAVTPFNLVFLAYQGFFESEGIPKFNGLVEGYASGQVTAEELVQVAIDMRRLPSSAISDRTYLEAVNQQLDTMTRNTR